jgi:hypothetical protein
MLGVPHVITPTMLGITTTMGMLTITTSTITG